MYSPPGVPAMVLATGTVLEPSRRLTPRGTAVLPTTLHRVPFAVPLFMMSIGPFNPKAIADGVARAVLELNGIGGNAMLPMACILFGSTMLMLSPPEFAT